MIVVDTSALLAILLNENEARRCLKVLSGEDERSMSAGTLLEAFIVSQHLRIEDAMHGFIQSIAPEIVAVTEASARRAAVAYTRWGKGVRPAGLNYGDCFAYELAMSRACPLLFVGADFARTDVKRPI